MPAKFIHFIASLFFALIFAACGDTTVIDGTVIDIIRSGETLDSCSQDNAGTMVYVFDSAAVYYCNGSWKLLDDDKIKKDTIVVEKTVTNVDTVVVRKVDTVVVNNIDTVYHLDTLTKLDTLVVMDTIHSIDTVVGLNGEDGEDGENGADGKDLVLTSGTVSYFIDFRDGKQYKAVTIGTQTWMAENLNYAYNEPTSSRDSSSACPYFKADSCAKYGRLYLWSAAMDSSAIFSDDGKGCGYGVYCLTAERVRGVCPKGWHLPSLDEWFSLFATVGGDSIAGIILKSEVGWDSSGNGSNYYGFSALPAGEISGSIFHYTNKYGYFWTSTEKSDDSPLKSHAEAITFSYKLQYAYKFGRFKDAGRSVRCLKDSN